MHPLPWNEYAWQRNECNMYAEGGVSWDALCSLGYFASERTQEYSSAIWAPIGWNVAECYYDWLITGCFPSDFAE